MTISGFLPHRWRSSPEIARHAEAIAGVLNTAPLQQTATGPAVNSLLGTTEVLPYLVAIKSLHRQLGRGRVVIVDDGTLTGEDRAILAHHCGDPELIAPREVRHGPFPSGSHWALLLTVLDRRAGQYWISLDPHTVTLAPIPEIELAIATNRGFVMASGGTGIAGFAAGAAGRTVASSWLAGLEKGQPEAAEDAARFILSNEPGTVELPRRGYIVWRAKPARAEAALIHFPPDRRFAGDDYAAASAATIADFPR